MCVSVEENCYIFITLYYILICDTILYNMWNSSVGFVYIKRIYTIVTTSFSDPFICACLRQVKHKHILSLNLR